VTASGCPVGCNLYSVRTITAAGTIDDLVTDAATRRHQVTTRLIRDWTQAGLLDSPRKRPAGKGHGSRQALYPAAQRELFLTLLHHRAGNGIKSLARIPVGIWMYWGEEYVPLRQVRRAMTTWMGGDPRVSMKRAKEIAHQILRQMDNPDATTTARTALLNTLTRLLYTTKAGEEPDFEQLERAVRDVFEPGHGQIRRAVGHPAAPMTTESMIALAKARATAVRLLVNDQVSDAEFIQARHAHLLSYAEYATHQRELAASAPPDHHDMYEPVTAELALNACCGHLLTSIGLAHLHPARAAQPQHSPAPKITFTA
jgi:hypothetical protein